jgi:hypothetical protein
MTAISIGTSLHNTFGVHCPELLKADVVRSALIGAMPQLGPKAWIFPAV